MSKHQQKAIKKLESTYREIVNDLTSITEQSAKGTGAPIRSWETCKSKKKLDSLLELLLVSERTCENCQDLSTCMKQALEVGVFDILAGFAIQDKPPGLFAAILTFYSNLIKGVTKDCLMPTLAFHRTMTCLLLTISENLKKNVQFYKADQEILDFVHTICIRVHKMPMLMEILLVKEKGKTDEYVLLPILLHYFKQAKDEGSAKMRELMELCVQVDNREVLQRLIYFTDFTSALVLKLQLLFRSVSALDYRTSRPGNCPVLDSYLRYCEFLNNICEKCLWQDLLECLVNQFSFHFLEREVFPMLASDAYSQAIYVPTT